MSIALERVVKRFEGSAVIDGCSLEVADGELFVLLGASGSGKSTILRLIAGLTPLDEGRILLHGRRVDRLPPQARGVGFVFQSYALFRHMSVAENIAFGLRIRGVSHKERRARVDGLLDLIGLRGLGERMPQQLSGGQAQRVALARALAYEPSVLLLDEPFGALDVKIRGRLRESLRRIQRDLKVPTILVTHDQEEAFELADRLGVMERGRLVEVGRPEDLYRAPRTEYVATFLGAGNVVAGRVERGRLRLGKTLVELPAGVSDAPSGTALAILFRPEDVTVAPPSAPAPERAVSLGTGTVVERVFSGAFERLRVRCPDLAGAQPVVPAPTYGDEAILLHALHTPRMDFHARPGDEVQVTLRAFHAFPHPGLRMLVLAEKGERAAAMDAGVALARSLQGPVTILAVGADDAEAGLRHAELDPLSSRLRDGLFGLELVTRTGEPATELGEEASERAYDICVAFAASAEEARRLRVGVAERARVPIVLVPRHRPALRSVLICTAVGEPGKADIELGGRIARRAGASVTILHVRAGSPTADDLGEKARSLEPPDLAPVTAAHLAKGLMTLGRLTVEGQVKVRTGAILDEILSEARAGDYDLIVLGARGGAAAPGRAHEDIAAAVLATGERPVLVVPLREA